jgi:hypothetical protein
MLGRELLEPAFVAGGRPDQTPRRARRNAVTRPIPVDAPVTITRVPSSSM